MQTVNTELKKFLDNLASALDTHSQEVEAIETEHRPGYSPYSHNKGGFELKAFTDLRYFYGSGEHNGTYAERFIEYCIARDRQSYMRDQGITEIEPESADDEVWCEGLGDDSNSVFFQATCMFTSATTMDVNLYFEATDAPYHRGLDFKFETEIEFDSLEAFKAELKKLVPTFKKFFMLTNSKQGTFESAESRSIYGYSIRLPMSEIDKSV